jgi:hypothetical protein
MAVADGCVRGEISCVDGGDVNKLLRERHVRPNGTCSSHLVLETLHQCSC